MVRLGVRGLALGAWIALFGACASTDFYPAGAERYPPTDPASIAVHMEEPPEGVSIIGTAVVDSSDQMSLQKALAKLKQEAARRGGHGICRVQLQQGGLFGGHLRGATCAVFRISEAGGVK